MTTAAAATPLTRVRNTVAPGSVPTAFFQHVISPSVAVATPDVPPPERFATFQPAGHAGIPLNASAKCKNKRSCATAAAGTTTLSPVPAPVIAATVPAPPVLSTAGSMVYGRGSLRSLRRSSSHQLRPVWTVLHVAPAGVTLFL